MAEHQAFFPWGYHCVRLNKSLSIPFPSPPSTQPHFFLLIFFFLSLSTIAFVNEP